MSTQIQHDLDWVTFIEPDEPCGAFDDCPNHAAWLGVFPFECEHVPTPYCDQHRAELIHDMLLEPKADGWKCLYCSAWEYGTIKFIPLKGAS